MTLLANAVLQISLTLCNIATLSSQLHKIVTHHYKVFPKISLKATVHLLDHPRVAWAISIMVLGIVAAKIGSWLNLISAHLGVL